MKEKQRKTASGFVYLILLIVILIGSIAAFINFAKQGGETGNPFPALLCVFLFAFDILCFKGLFDASIHGKTDQFILRFKKPAH